MKAQRVIQREKEIEKLQQELESKRLLQEPVAISVNGQFGYSQGSLLGAYGLKSTYNLGAYFFNMAYGSEKAPMLKSTRAGALDCIFGNVTFSLEFDKQNPNHAEYGAIPVPQQLELSAQLDRALNEGNLTPQTILNFLEALRVVQIDQQIIVMIEPYSLAFAGLKEKCKAMIQATKKE